MGALATRPHALLGMALSDVEALAFDVTVLRAAKRHRATEAVADLQQMETDDGMGIGRVLAMLFRLVTRGR